MVINRNTRQKEIIIKEVNNLNQFFNANELYEKVNKKDSKIGIATVYRILRDLRKRNILHSYICNRKTIYSKDDRSHCHFTCQKCGKISHLSIKSLNFLENTNKSICHFQIDVEGVCESCRK